MTVGEVEAESAVPSPDENSHPWPKEVAPVPPFPTVSAEASMSVPVEENDEVALLPKYAGPYAEKRVVEAL